MAAQMRKGVSRKIKNKNKSPGLPTAYGRSRDLGGRGKRRRPILRGIDREMSAAAGRIEELISSSASAASWWRQSSIDEDLRQISSELRSMGAAIDYGEHSRETREAVRIWMNQIAAVFYDLEDVMDDIDELIMEPKQKRRHYYSSSSYSKLPCLIVCQVCSIPLPSIKSSTRDPPSDRSRRVSSPTHLETLAGVRVRNWGLPSGAVDT